MNDSTTNHPRIVLASGSPRRKELLAGVNLAFEVILPTVDERDLETSHLPFAEQVKALSRYKGESVAQSHPDALVIAADTIVVWNNEVLGKPRDKAHAFEMLNKLQNSTHSVFSGITVFHQGRVASDALETEVRMRPLSPGEIDQYIATGEPMDKAGAYAIQGYGSVLIERIDGCYFNVVGMSMYLLDRLSTTLGFSLFLQPDMALNTSL